MHYPLFIDLKGKRILIVGGGKVGTRRSGYLLDAGALVDVVSLDFDSKLISVKNKNLKLIKKEINEKNISKIKFEDYFLVVISTNDKNINEKISDKIKNINKKIKNKILVCRADNYPAGDVVFPAVSKVGKNTIAFTTFGKNPGLSRKVKESFKNAKKA